MIERNFILTDVMKTGDHITNEGFIKINTLPNQTFDLNGEYYTLHNYKMETYNRRIALLDIKQRNSRLQGNLEFAEELEKRLKNLKKQNFKIIASCPWESEENFKTSNYYPTGYKNQFLWHGQQSWFWYYMVNKHIKNTLSFNHTEKKFDYLYLNKTPRKHRVKLYNRLIQDNCLENSLYSFTHYKNGVKLNSMYELPWIDTTQRYPIYDYDQDIYEKPYNETGCSIVSETNDNDTDVFITEKIWKPIIAGHIFIVHGNYRYLKKLREIGFKTFESVFDESYDEIRDPDKRIDALVELIQKLKGSEWNELYKQTEDIRKHNRKTFWTKSYLSNLVNKELLRWFEFVDHSQISS
jgi:hypothetical protein